jgi:hypothetical protein
VGDLTGGAAGVAGGRDLATKMKTISIEVHLHPRIHKMDTDPKLLESVHTGLNIIHFC